MTEPLGESAFSLRTAISSRTIVSSGEEPESTVRVDEVDVDVRRQWAIVHEREWQNLRATDQQSPETEQRLTATIAHCRLRQTDARQRAFAAQLKHKRTRLPKRRRHAFDESLELSRVRLDK